MSKDKVWVRDRLRAVLRTEELKHMLDWLLKAWNKRKKEEYPSLKVYIPSSEEEE